MSRQLFVLLDSVFDIDLVFLSSCGFLLWYVGLFLGCDLQCFLNELLHILILEFSSYKQNKFDKIFDINILVGFWQILGNFEELKSTQNFTFFSWWVNVVDLQESLNLIRIFNLLFKMSESKSILERET